MLKKPRSSKRVGVSDSDRRRRRRRDDDDARVAFKIVFAGRRNVRRAQWHKGFFCVSRGFAAWGGASRRRGCAVHGPRGSRFPEPARRQAARSLAGRQTRRLEESSLAERRKSSIAAANTTVAAPRRRARRRARRRNRSLAVRDEAFDRARFDRRRRSALKRPAPAQPAGETGGGGRLLHRYLRALRAYTDWAAVVFYAVSSRRRARSAAAPACARPPPRRTSQPSPTGLPRRLPPRTTRKSSRAGSGTGWALCTARTLS